YRQLGDRLCRSWLERLEPPAIDVELRVGVRDSPLCYVPTNDDRITLRFKAIESSDAKIREQLRVLPDRRGRKSRQFASAALSDATVRYLWNANPESRILDALRSLCREVTRVGSAASLVRCWLESPSVSTAPLQPTSLHPTMRLRVPCPGRLDVLTSAFLASPDELPPSGPYRGYGMRSAHRDELPSCSLAGTTLVLAIGGRARLLLPDALAACDAVRATILARCPIQPPPEWLSGHRADGSPSERDHLAIVPIPRIDSPNADARIVGMAVLVPWHVGQSDRRMALDPAVSPDFGSGCLTVGFGGSRGRQFSLQPFLAFANEAPMECWPWSGPPSGASLWTSVTPIAVDHHHTKMVSIVDSIARSCERVGLPRPHSVAVVAQPPLPGVTTSQRMPLLRRRSDGRRRRHLHALIDFGRPVRGPIVIGAGRYRGYGLLAPVPSHTSLPASAWIDPSHRSPAPTRFASPPAEQPDSES
ncbi:MAG: type I-G CRISPR-associated protein Csb2, partial [Phycisphaerales bacterium]